MSEGLIIADASPLIGLERIDRLILMHRLFDVVIVPAAVAREVGPAIARLPWINKRLLRLPLDPRIAHAHLGHGESEALSLALEHGQARVVVDDLPARDLAEALGLPTVGTLGILLAAKRLGLLSAIRPEVDALVANEFRMDSTLYGQILAMAGEHERSR